VLDAAPGAELLLGVADGVTLDDVRAAAGTAALVDLLRAVPARPGDVVHLPAGMIHALGAGVLVAEVQTPSDVTHRLWDWPDERDGGRELHVADGLTSIAAGWEHNRDVSAAHAADGPLVTTDAYQLARVTLDAGAVLPASAAGGTVRVAIVLDGGLVWRDPDLGERHRARTECVVLPAASTVPVRAGRDGATVLVATA
jgi:mannose-6-phosphate isomerase